MIESCLPYLYQACLRDASPRLDGQMTREVQAQNLSSFRGDSSNTVFLISLKAGGTGLNLPCASSVVLVSLPAGALVLHTNNSS